MRFKNLVIICCFFVLCGSFYTPNQIQKGGVSAQTLTEPTSIAEYSEDKVNSFDAEHLPKQALIRSNTAANVRSGPSIHDSLITRLQGGTTVTIKSVKEIAGWKWFEIIHQDDKPSGWTREDNLDLLFNKISTISSNKKTEENLLAAQLQTKNSVGGNVNGTRDQDVLTETEKLVKSGFADLTLLGLCAIANTDQEFNTIKTLIKAGANHDARNQSGQTVLMVAASQNKNPKIIKELVKAGANVNDTITDDFVFNGNVNGISINYSLKGFTALMLAASNNQNPDVIMALVEAGADVNIRTPEGVTALIAAADNKNSDVITTLIAAGANVADRAENGMTALMCAAAANTNPKVINALIKAGSNVNAKSEKGFTALLYAASTNPNSEVITTLINAGANVNAKAEDGGSILMCAAAANPSSEVITTLIKAGANVNDKTNTHGKTALIIAAQNSKNPAVIIELINAGADAKVLDSDGKTAFDYAKENAHIKDSQALWAINQARFD